MKIEELQVGQIVDILYRTEMNCTPKPRNWWINNDQIIRIFEVK